MPVPDDLSEIAACLAAEVLSGAREERPAEWFEALLLSALGQAKLRERERCAKLAEERARMWQTTRLNDPAWPAGARAEAQERYKEAIAIADAIRSGEPTPPVA